MKALRISMYYGGKTDKHHFNKVIFVCKHLNKRIEDLPFVFSGLRFTRGTASKVSTEHNSSAYFDAMISG